MFIPALFGVAGEKRTLLFGGFFNQKSGAAHGAFLSHGLVPQGKRAVGKITASVEYFTPFGPSLQKGAAAGFFGTRDAGSLTSVGRDNRMRIFTLRVTAAGIKRTVFSLFYEHEFSTFFADSVGSFVRRRFNRMYRPFFIPGVVPGIRTFRIVAAT